MRRWRVCERQCVCVCDGMLFLTNCLKSVSQLTHKLLPFLLCHYLTSPPVLAHWLRFKTQRSALLSAATQAAKWKGSLLIWNALHSQLITIEFDIYMLLKQLWKILLNMGRMHRKWSVFCYFKLFYLAFKYGFYYWTSYDNLFFFGEACMWYCLIFGRKKPI